MTLLLSRANVQEILTMEDTIEILEEAFCQLALGNVLLPQRTAITIEDYHGLHLGMPAYIGGDVNALALKVVTIYPENPSKYELPTTIGTLLLSDSRTGEPKAIMDAGYLTAVRTGAASGVATKYLARQDAKTVGVFGAGVQAQTQLWAINTVREIERALVYAPNSERAATWAQEMSEKLNIPVQPVQHPRQAVENMDIVIAATSSKEPIFDGDWLSPGTHINGIGSHAPNARELDTRTVARSKIVPDLRSACLAEAGDLLIPIQEGAIQDEFGPDLGEVVARLKPGRENDSQITLFKSVGLAIQDVSTANHVFNLAQQQGIGEEFNF